MGNEQRCLKYTTVTYQSPTQQQEPTCAFFGIIVSLYNMHLRYYLVLIMAVVSVVSGFTDIYNDSAPQNLRNKSQQDSKSQAHLQPNKADEERGNFGLSQMVSFFKKKPNLSKVKTLLRIKMDISKRELLPPGQNLDITQMRTRSGEKVDLTKMFSKSRIFTRTASDSDVQKFKKMAEKDPDLRSISSVVGKNPTEFSAKQVEGVQSYLRKDPDRLGKIIKRTFFGVFFGTLGLLFFAIVGLLVGGLVMDPRGQ